ncbi:C_GCAxxG_C_C family protein [bacterium]|nr:C_GCAxxG_C_C family protein [bacterium]
MPNRSEIAHDCFNKGYNCAQSVLFAFHDLYSIDQEVLLKIASGFGAGMARKQEVCGAVTGGLMVLSLLYGSPDAHDTRAKEKVYDAITIFMDRFQDQYGSCLCRELLGVDLKTKSGQSEYRDRALKDTICMKCVKEAVRLVWEIIETPDNSYN